MHYRFAERLSHAPKSFLDELFRVSADRSLISFAGGLPSSTLIDTEGIQNATCQVMEEDPATALQYTTTDGYLPLREFIADRYRSRLGIPATAMEIQIVNGSQQCLDLFCKNIPQYRRSRRYRAPRLPRCYRSILVIRTVH